MELLEDLMSEEMKVFMVFIEALLSGEEPEGDSKRWFNRFILFYLVP